MDKKTEALALYAKLGSSIKVAKELGISDRSVRFWVQKQKQVGESVELTQNDVPKRVDQVYSSGLPQLNFDIKNGTILVISDPHQIPGEGPSIAARAALAVAKQLDPKPVMVVENGDIFDFASISKHDKLGWAQNFSVKEEIEAGMGLLQLFAEATPGAKHIAIEGNHCTRFNKFLSKHVPQFKGVPGFNLTDHLPKEWVYAMSIMINKNIIFLHAHVGGTHAALTNTIRAGMSIITGHTHLGIVNPFTDYNGTRYGVQVPTLATIQSNPLFAYTNGTVLNWQSGFCVLTIIDYELQYPELCMVNNKGQAFFRGQIIDV